MIYVRSVKLLLVQLSYTVQIDLKWAGPGVINSPSKCAFDANAIMLAMS